MLLKYGTDENLARSGMVMLEIAAVTDYGKIFAESCYTLEGNSAVILRASSVFERLESTIGTQPPLLQVHSIVEKALELIVKSRDILSGKKRRIEDSWTAGFEEVTDCKGRITALKLEKRTILGGTSQSGRRRVLVSSLVNENDLEWINDKILDTSTELGRLQSQYEVVVTKK